MNRREFLTGATACAAVVAMPMAPAHAVLTWTDVPGTDIAIRGDPAVIAGWKAVFERGRDSFSHEFMRTLIRGDWEYFTSPNYRGAHGN